jgi:hypothetical protein
VGFIAALFVGTLGWLLVHDIQRHETALVSVRAHRGSQPVAYWAIMAFWLACLVISALFALASYVPDSACEGEKNCIVVVLQAPPQ